MNQLHLVLDEQQIGNGTLEEQGIYEQECLTEEEAGEYELDIPGMEYDQVLELLKNMGISEGMYEGDTKPNKDKTDPEWNEPTTEEVNDHETFMRALLPAISASRVVNQIQHKRKVAMAWINAKKQEYKGTMVQRDKYLAKA
jgi:hypothetical protein